MSSRPRVGVLFGFPPYRGTTLNLFARAVLVGLQRGADRLSIDLLISAGIDYQHRPYNQNGAWPVPVQSIETVCVPVGPWNCDGILMVGSPPTDEQIEYLRDVRRNGTPVVYAYTYVGSPRVVSDDAGGIRRLVDYLVERGHRRIAFAAGYRRPGSDHMVRYQAYCDRMKHHGVEVDPMLVVWDSTKPDTSRRGFAELIHERRDFTALLAHSGEAAEGAIQAFEDGGIVVPGQVEIVSYDGSPWFRPQPDEVPSMDARIPEVAERALEVLSVELGRHDGPAPTEETLVEPVFTGDDKRSPADFRRIGLDPGVADSPDVLKIVRGRLVAIQDVRELIHFLPHLLRGLMPSSPSAEQTVEIERLRRTAGTIYRDAIDRRELYTETISKLSGRLHRAQTVLEVAAATLLAMPPLGIEVGGVSVLGEGVGVGEGLLATVYLDTREDPHAGISEASHEWNELPPFLTESSPRTGYQVAVLPLMSDERLTGLLWLQMRGQTVHATIADLVSTSIDRITQTQHLEQALKDKQVLLQEVHHRVKNNLSMVASLLSLREGTEPNPEFGRTLRELRERVYSVALVHEKLYGTPSLETISLASLIEDLTDQLLRSLSEYPLEVTKHIRCDRITITPTIAVPLGLVVTEIITNAVKYAFPCTEHPELRIDATVSHGICTVIISDNGPGIPEGQVAGSGLGMTLISALVEQMRGKLSIRGGSGTTIEMSFPLGGSTERTPDS
jgi:two-component sensor histidine kinase